MYLTFFCPIFILSKQAIGTLHEAEVNVWMITGDKAETGLAIGKKCNLIDLQRQELERIVNLSDEALRLRVMNLHAYVFTRKQREEKRRHDEQRANGEFPCFFSVANEFCALPGPANQFIWQF